MLNPPVGKVVSASDGQTPASHWPAVAARQPCPFSHADASTSPSLWVGTHLGSVLAVSLTVPLDSRHTQPVIASPSGERALPPSPCGPALCGGSELGNWHGYEQR